MTKTLYYLCKASRWRCHFENKHYSPKSPSPFSQIHVFCSLNGDYNDNEGIVFKNSKIDEINTTLFDIEGVLSDCENTGSFSSWSCKLAKLTKRKQLDLKVNSV